MFVNTPNSVVQIDGKSHWISRSVAVVAVVMWNNEILITKRGENVSATGKWCVPCGYLDWDESASQCVSREIYEETGLNISQFQVTGLENPYEIVTDPEVNWKQDIALHYLIKISSQTRPEFDISKTDSGEVLDIKWILESEIEKFEFAFNHDKRILKCLKIN
jgi:ADP-ribose pyrophosphatase YjhB (NUDIX family)